MPFLNTPHYPQSDGLTGTAIMPRTHVPTQCAAINSKEPYCDEFSTAMPSCKAHAESYIYHVEDRHDSALSLVNMVLEDADLWTGHMELQVTLAMAADLALSQQTSNDPAPMLETVAGTFNTQCVRSRATRQCAQNQEDALGGVPVLDFEFLEFSIVPTQERKKEVDGTCLFVGAPQFACQASATGCSCRSQTYFPTDGQVATDRRETYKAIMFYTVAAKAGAVGAGEVYETGYLDITYTTDDIESGNYVVTGSLTADQGKVSSIHRGEDIDWFPASPMNITGKYPAAEGRFFLKAVTETQLNPVYTVDVWSKYGSVYLPEAQVAVQRGSVTCVADDGSQLRAETCVTIVGTINQINSALSRVEYVVPSSLPHLNTMSIDHGIYGRVEEYLRVRVDDKGSSGIACLACVQLKNRLLLDFNVIIVSENDRPLISGPSYLSVGQNQDLSFANLTVVDPDSRDIIMGRTGPIGGAQVLVHVSCGYCTLRAPTMHFHSDDFNITVNFMEEACESVCPGVSEAMPLKDHDALLLLPPTCRLCLKDHGWKAMREGRGELTFFSTLAQAQVFLKDLTYKGIYGYNSRWVKTEIARQVECEKIARILPEPKEDKVVVQVSDLFNTGCTNETWQPHRTAVFSTWVEVTDFDDAPTITLFKNGEDVCAAACARNDALCCRPLTVIRAHEDTPVLFGKAVAIMFDSPEFLNFEFPAYNFKTQVTVKHGTLSFPVLDDPNFDLWYPADFEWLLPTDAAEVAGAQCTWDKAAGGTPTECAANGYRGFTVSSPMCVLNELIDLLVYSPDVDYNTILGVPEQLRVSIDSEPSSFTTAAPGTIIVEIFVAATNDVALVRLNTKAEFALSPDIFAPVSVEGEFMDFHEGGLQTSNCRSNVRCFSLYDADICEDKFVATNTSPGDDKLGTIKDLTADTCADTSTSAGNMRLLVKTSIGSVWFFSRLEWELSDVSVCVSRGRGCSTDEEWTAFIAVARPPTSAGKDSRNVDIVKPLPYFKRGLLRYFSNPVSALADNISIYVDDLNGTGAPGAGADGTCCCIDAACSACAFTSGVCCNVRCSVWCSVCAACVAVCVAVWSSMIQRAWHASSLQMCVAVC